MQVFRHEAWLSRGFGILGKNKLAPRPVAMCISTVECTVYTVRAGSIIIDISASIGCSVSFLDMR